MSSASSGQWSYNEHLLFEKACVLFGWGRWKEITNWMVVSPWSQIFVVCFCCDASTSFACSSNIFIWIQSQGCGRSRDQVKSHAQKFAQARPHERKRFDTMIHNNPRREKRTPSKMSTEEVILTPMTASMATALMNLKHTFVSTPNIFSSWIIHFAFAAKDDSRTL